LSPAPSKPQTAAQRVAARIKLAQEAEAKAAAEAKKAAAAEARAPASDDARTVVSGLTGPAPARAGAGSKAAPAKPPKAGLVLGKFAKGAKPAGVKAPRQRWTMTIGPATILIVLVAFVLIGGWAAIATSALIFGDKLSARLVAQQSDMQFAYEQKLVVFRTQLDRFARQTRMQQDGVEGRIADLMLRQAALEARQAMLTALADQTRAPDGARPTQFGDAGGGPIRAASVQRPAPPKFLILDASHPVVERVNHLEGAIDRVERTQLGSLNGLMQRSQTTLLQLRSAFSEVGLEAEKIVPAAAQARGQVANLLPDSKDFGGGPFESNVAQIRRTLSVLGRLRTAANAVPFIRPIPASGGLMTSSYGTRSDPFTGEARFHAGMDFRSPIGVPVLAAGAGVVQSAGVGGGYGNLVIVDHGNGVTTRYAHLHEFKVVTGQPVSTGTVVGLVGSTGRSTGPHLHYETRVNGEPSDPGKFIRAGERIYLTQ
jgi:murein DD-endopeptidase MepM/ murein hydrolase activator NlpD